jgi:chaperone modulatory protein CbpM
MENHQIVTSILVDDNEQVYSVTQLCEAYHISEGFLMQLLEHGLLDTVTPPAKQNHFNVQMVKRICSARRLQDDLGVNIEGVVLVIELLDELEQLRSELSILRHHVK